MIFFDGEIYENDMCDKLSDRFEDRICDTLGNCRLSANQVMLAAEKISTDIENGAFDDMLSALDVENVSYYKQLILACLSRENLEYRLKTELGDSDGFIGSPNGITPKIKIQTKPLGVLFHIAAGNADGLPVMSVAEGLLAGNINILKLPSADKGLSIRIIKRLCKYEPLLSRYIYVFDTPSSDVRTIQALAGFADGIVVWGGTEAVKAVRSLAPPGVKLIEWGHKLGFCYISDYANHTDEFSALAEHIASTKQLLCSSCQTVFIDTDDKTELTLFCEMFLPYLEAAVGKHRNTSIGTQARDTLISYSARLEQAIGIRQISPDVFYGKNCSLIIKDDFELELSPMMCNVLVKRLPRKDIMRTLRNVKGFLQTAGLICDKADRAELTDLLLCAGVTRVTQAGNMSAYFFGESHDGEYPLSRYTRKINIELNDQTEETNI